MMFYLLSTSIYFALISYFFFKYLHKRDSFQRLDSCVGAYLHCEFHLGIGIELKVALEDSVAGTSAAFLAGLSAVIRSAASSADLAASSRRESAQALLP